VGMTLALSVASKGYTLLVTPLFLRFLGRRWKLCLLSGALTLAALTVPYWSAGAHALEGFRAYGAQWERNAGAFRAVVWAYQRWGLDEATASSRAKVVVLVALLLFLVHRWRQQRPGDFDHLVESSFLTLALFFLLSPTVYPWYLTWAVPWLCFRLSVAWLWFTGLVVIEYLYNFDFYSLAWFADMAARAPAAFRWLFHTWHPYAESEMTWIRLVQHVPVWLLLAWEWARGWPSARRWQQAPPRPPVVGESSVGACEEQPGRPLE